MSLLTGGRPQAGSRHSLSEVRLLLTQAMNTKIKAAYFQEVMGDGERIPAGSMKVRYGAIPVISWRGKSMLTLPAMPVQLPRNMGVWEITSSEDPDCQFIPYQSGQRWMMRKEKLLSKVIGQYGFEVNGLEVLFDTDLLNSDNPITEVEVVLIIADTNKLGDWDLVPLPADMVGEVIQEVYKLLSTKGPADTPSDPVAEQIQYKK